MKRIVSPTRQRIAPLACARLTKRFGLTIRFGLTKPSDKEHGLSHRYRLEVHVQLLTKTKLFCGCSTQFGLPPNSATCPVCIGMPGVLPVMNRRAFDLALKAALALNCRIASSTKWDAKNYYYPDLPKNYQISQYDLPFSEEAGCKLKPPATVKKIGIIRAHLEEGRGQDDARRTQERQE